MQAEDGLDETSFQDTVRDQKKKNRLKAVVGQGVNG